MLWWLIALIYLLIVDINAMLLFRRVPWYAISWWLVLYLILSPVTILYSVGMKVYEKVEQDLNATAMCVVDEESGLVYGWASWEEYMDFVTLMATKIAEEQQQDVRFSLWDLHDWKIWEPHVTFLLEEGVLEQQEVNGYIVLFFKK